jgi:hypothetical protein
MHLPRRPPPPRHSPLPPLASTLHLVQSNTIADPLVDRSTGRTRPEDLDDIMALGRQGCLSPILAIPCHGPIARHHHREAKLTASDLLHSLIEATIPPRLHVVSHGFHMRCPMLLPRDQQNTPLTRPFQRLLAWCGRVKKQGYCKIPYPAI